MEIEQLYSLYLSSGRVNTDSRKVEEGEIFFGLKGENFDGCDFALDALRSGAAYAVVSEEWAKPHSKEYETEFKNRVIKTKDTLKTLQALAKWHREHIFLGDERLQVIAVTGTNGKTTTKELIKAVLSKKYCVTATEGNLNNNIGVPLSLLKMGAETTEIAVIEMGASHPGDLKELCEIAQPDFGLITNVGKAHLQGFGSFEGVKKAKGELYDFIKSKGQRIFYNADSEDLCDMVCSRRGLKTVKYGARFQGAVTLQPNPKFPFLRMLVPVLKTDPLTGRVFGQKEMLEVSTNLIGAYNADNIMAAIAVGKYFGISEEAAIEAIGEYRPSNNRSQLVKTYDNTLIVDAYNANPGSVNAAIDNFANIDARQKVVLLGDMRELGADSQGEHRAMVEKISKLQERGKITKAYYVGAEFGKVAESFADVDALIGYLKENPLQRATVLIKGSHSMQMERVVDSL